MVLNMLIFVVWTPAIILTKDAVLQGIFHQPGRAAQIFKDHMESVDSFTLGTLPFLVSLFRLNLSIIFLGSFMLRPIIMRPVNLVWRRIVESDKPVFTMTFGGAAAFATAISEAVKHL